MNDDSMSRAAVYAGLFMLVGSMVGVMLGKDAQTTAIMGCGFILVAIYLKLDSRRQ